MEYEKYKKWTNSLKHVELSTHVIIPVHLLNLDCLRHCLRQLCVHCLQAPAIPDYPIYPPRLPHALRGQVRRHL